MAKLYHTFAHNFLSLTTRDLRHYFVTMTNDPPARDTSGDMFYRVLTWIVLAACVTSATVSFSMRRGRLTLAPGFDDIGYMGDGAERARIFWESGPDAFFANLKKYPPHSPFSTALATSGFLIFGVRDWAPYVMNGVLVLGFLWIGDHLLRGLKFWKKLIGYFFLISAPLIVCSVYEFRPDIACALVTITACIITIEKPLLGASFRRLLLIGGLFGLALVVKPTTLPATIVMMLGSMFLSTAADVLGRDRELTAEGMGRSWGTVFVVLFLEALPYFAFAGKQVIAYIKENVFGAHAKIWAAKGTRLQHAKFYLTGDGGRLMLGEHLWLLLGLIAIAWIFCLIRGKRSEIARAIALLMLLFGSFFSVVMNPVESYFFGLPFHMCALLLGIASLGYIMAHSRYFIGTAVAIIALILGIYNFHWPDNYDNYTSPIATSRRQIVYGSFDTIVEHRKPGRTTVLIEGVGDINSSVMQYIASQRQLDIQFYFVPDTGRKGPTEREWNRCDFVIASEKDTQITADFLFDYKLLDDMLADLRKRPDYKQIAYFPFIKSNKGYYVFERVRSDEVK